MLKRDYDPVQSSSWPPTDPSKKKKRKSRWAEEERDKSFIPGLPSVMPTGMNGEQEEQYLLQLQIEEISRRLRTGDLGIPLNPDDRSPSPEPIYNNEGKRLNTREYRTRKKLEDERHHLVTKAMELNTDYKPPADYKPPVIRVNDKVMIPQEEHPDINFVGLLIGPRGNTLKNLEKETGAKIIIRGKGSVKEGKIGRKDGQPLPGEDEPLHAYVTASNPENVAKAVDKIKEIIRQGIEVPEGENDLRRQQLRELALLNGTLRENDGLAKLKQLQQAQTIITNTIICSICGGSGHIAQDCKQKRPGDTFRAMQNQSSQEKAKMDSEYMSLMAELGEGPPPPKYTFGNRPPPPNRTSFMLPPPNVPQLALPWQQQSAPVRPPAIGPPSNSIAGPPAMPMGPPVVSSAPMITQPSWQGIASSSQMPAPTITSSGGVPPMMPPPPPPPNALTHTRLTSAHIPWQQQQQRQQQQQQQPLPTRNFGVTSSVSGKAPVNQTPPWQQQAPVAPVPPPPPMCSMPPWQQQTPPPPMQQTAAVHSHAALPPPPAMSVQSSFNPIAPPPPPPGQLTDSHNVGLPTGIPLGVPPPPPPN